MKIPIPGYTINVDNKLIFKLALVGALVYTTYKVNEVGNNYVKKVNEVRQNSVKESQLEFKLGGIPKKHQND